MPWQRLADFATLFTGLATHGRGLIECGDAPVRLISYKHIQRHALVEQLDESTTSNEARLQRHRVEPGDVLVTARGAEPKVAIVSRRHAGAYITNMVIGIRPLKARSEVLWAYLTSKQGQGHLKGLNQGTTAMLSLSTKTLGDMPIPMPTEATQERLASLVNSQQDWDAITEDTMRQRRALTYAAIEAALHEEST